MNADSTATVNVRAPICTTELLGSRAIEAARTLIAPDLCSDWLMISTAATVITAGSPNPENAFSDGTRPQITAVTSAPIATMSYRQRPQANRISDATMIAKAASCSVVISISGALVGSERPYSRCFYRGATNGSLRYGCSAPRLVSGPQPPNGLQLF